MTGIKSPFYPALSASNLPMATTLMGTSQERRLSQSTLARQAALQIGIQIMTGTLAHSAQKKSHWICPRGLTARMDPALRLT